MDESTNDAMIGTYRTVAEAWDEYAKFNKLDSCCAETVVLLRASFITGIAAALRLHHNGATVPEIVKQGSAFNAQTEQMAGRSPLQTHTLP